MRNFSLSRTGESSRGACSWLPSRSALALACWPLLVSLACNVYDDSLTVSTPLGGSGSNNSDAGAESGGKGGKGNTGGSDGGAASGNAGKTSSGSAGDGASGGSAGNGGASSGGAGGSAGSSGADAAGAGAGGVPMSEDGELVDNMEDNDAAVFPLHGRNGYWYTGGDSTAGAKLTPPTGKFAMTELPVGDRSDYAASVKAENFTDWGSDMGFNFVEKSGPQAWDATGFCGLRFWGKALAAVTLNFRVPDVSTHPAGGVCKDPAAGAGTACYDHFGIAVAFGKTWQQYSLKFVDLTQSGSGYHPPSGKLDTKKLFAVEWALPGQTAKTHQIWIDDVELVKCP